MAICVNSIEEYSLACRNETMGMYRVGCDLISRLDLRKKKGNKARRENRFIIEQVRKKE